MVTKEALWTGGHVTVMVSDMDRAWRFYTNTLGLDAGDRWGDHYAVVKAPGMEIGLHPGRGEGVVSEGFTLSLATSDLDGAVETLTRRGVRFDGGVSDDGGRRAINLSDPDGNPIHLREHWKE